MLSESSIRSGVGFYSLSPMFLFPSALHYLFPFASLCDLWRMSSSEMLEEKGVCAASVCVCSWYLHKKETETDGWKDNVACEIMGLTGKEMLGFFNLKFCSFGIRPCFEEIYLDTIHKMQQLWSKGTVASISAEPAIHCQGRAVFSVPRAVEGWCSNCHSGGSPLEWGQGTSLIELDRSGSGWKKSFPVSRAKWDAKAASFQAH